MNLTTIQQILAVDDRMPRKVSVPQWGGSVFVRSLSVADLDAVESMDRVGLVCAGLCDSRGNPLIITASQRRELYDRHPAAMDLIALEVLKASGLRSDDRPDPQMKAAFGPSQWRAIEGQLKGLANVSKNRRTSDNTDGQDGTVREGHKASQLQDQGV